MIEVIAEEPRRHWLTWDGADEIGRAIAVVRPDRRRFVRFADCNPDAYRPLTDAVADDLGGNLGSIRAGERRLRELDETLREDIPGSAGWRWTDDGFREETFGFGFDPAI